MTKKIKCKCGVELFSKDQVETDFGNPVFSDWNGERVMGFSIGTYFKYRCPKCFTIKTVKVDRKCRNK